MPDGNHEGSPADNNYGTGNDKAWGLGDKSVGSRRKINSASSQRTPIKDAQAWAEFRIAIADIDSFGLSHKVDKKPEKTITDATPKASVQKKQHAFDHFIQNYKAGDPFPIVPPGYKMVVCRVGPENGGDGYGLIKDKDNFVVNGKEYSEKGVLGMTLGDDSRLPNLLLRIARARNIPFDEEGRLRCPEDTPGGGQFTDLQLSNCMIPSAQTVAGSAVRGAARVAQGATRATANAAKNAGVEVGKRVKSDQGLDVIGADEVEERSDILKQVARLRRAAAYRALGKRSFVTGRRSLRSRRQMKKALADAFPNVPENEIDEFLDIDITRFNSSAQIANYVKFRWGFIEAFLLEAEENKDWSKMLGSLRMSTTDANDATDIKYDVARVDLLEDGLFVLRIKPENVDEFVQNIAPNHLAATGRDMRTMGHYIGTHEFGHFADFRERLNKAGINKTTVNSDGQTVLDLSTNPTFKPLTDALAKETDEDKRKAIASQIITELSKLINAKDPSDGSIGSVVGSRYANYGFVDKDGYVEINAEFYAAWKLVHSVLLKADPALTNSPTKEDLEKSINAEFERRFGVPVDQIVSGGPRVAPNPPGKINRQMRRVGNKLSQNVRDRSEANRRNQGRRYRSPEINAHQSIIETVENVRPDGRTGEFYASRTQTPKEKGRTLPIGSLTNDQKDILVEAADDYLAQLEERFRNRMNLKQGDSISVDDILDQMATFEGTNGKEFGIWSADLHNMIVLDRLMSTGELDLINDVKRDGRYKVFELMGLDVGRRKSAEYYDIETKALPRRMRRIGRVLSARFDPKAEDGDGDGLVQDSTQFERPVNPKMPEKLRSDRPKMPSTKKRSIVRSKADAEKVTKDIIDALTDSYSQWSIVRNLNIKQTPSMSILGVRSYVDNATERVETKFGFIDTVGDAKSILSQLFRNVKIKDLGDDNILLTPEQKIAMIGIIDIASVVPEFKDWGIAFRPSNNGMNGSTRIVESGVRDQFSTELFDRNASIGQKWLGIEMTTEGSAVRENVGDIAQIMINPFTGRPVPILVPNEDILGDNVGVQIMKTVYSRGTNQSSKDARRQLHELAQVASILSMAHHEMGHAISESMAYDERPTGVSLAERDKKIVDTILPKTSLMARELMVKEVANTIVQIVQKAHAYDNIHQRLKDTVRDLPIEIQKLESAYKATSSTQIASALSDQIANHQAALDTFRDELRRSRQLRNLRDELENNSDLKYFILPFPPGHPMHGRDLNGDDKNLENIDVINELLALLSDPVFVEDVRDTFVYKAHFPDDPIFDENLQTDGTYKFKADISKFYDPNTTLGQIGLAAAASRYVSLNEVWDGIKDKTDQREILEFVKMFSTYGSTKPRYAGSMLESGDFEPQELFAELTALFMSGHGVKDYVIPQTVKQNIIKWFDWAFRGRQWVNIISPDGKEALGV